MKRIEINRVMMAAIIPPIFRFAASLSERLFVMIPKYHKGIHRSILSKC